MTLVLPLRGSEEHQRTKDDSPQFTSMTCAALLVPLFFTLRSSPAPVLPRAPQFSTGRRSMAATSTGGVSSLASVPGVVDAEAWMSDEEKELMGILMASGQEHLFAAWEPGQDEDKKHAFFDQVRRPASLGMPSSTRRASSAPPASR